MTDDLGGLFGQRLRELRHERDISQETLARYAGVHRHAVWRLERGEREPRLKTILMLARVLDVEPATLLTTAWQAVEQTSPGRDGSLDPRYGRAQLIQARLQHVESVEDDGLKGDAGSLPTGGPQ